MYYLFVILMMTLSTYVYCSVEHNQPSSLMIKTGESVTIFCKVSGYSLSDSSKAPSWIRYVQGKTLEFIGMIHAGGGIDYKSSLKNKFTISRDTSTNTVYLQGHNLHVEDTAVYYCVRYTGLIAFDYCGKGTQVTVTSTEPKKPVVFKMSECTTSTTQTHGCLASEYSPGTPLSFKWTYQNGTALTDFVEHPAVERNGTSLKISHITVTGNQLGKNITCKVVIDQAPTLSLVPVITQISTSVMCVIEDFHPKAITIQLMENKTNIQQLTTLGYTQDEDTGLYTARSLYTVSSETWNKHTEYTCEVTHMGQVKHVTKNIKATFELTLKSPLQRNIFLFGDVIFQAVVSGNEHKAVEDASVLCKVENETLPLSKAVIQSQDNSEFQKIYNVTVNRDKWFAGKMVTCTISDKNIKKKISFNKGEEPSVVIYEQHSKNKPSHVSLVCEVSSPQLGDVYIMWRVDNGKYEEGKTSAPIRQKDSTSVISLFEVSDKQYKESTISCAVVHANMENTKAPLLTPASKSKPSCTPCPVCSADYS